MQTQKELFFSTLLAALICMPQASLALRDPTRPVTADSGADSDLMAVRMIKFKPGDSVADIGGKIVKVGDEVNGMKVVEIKRDAVSLRGPDNSLVLAPIYPYIINKSTGKSYASKK